MLKFYNLFVKKYSHTRVQVDSDAPRQAIRDFSCKINYAVIKKDLEEEYRKEGKSKYLVTSKYHEKREVIEATV